MKIQAKKKRIPFFALVCLTLTILLAMAMANIADNEDVETRQRFYFYCVLIIPSFFYAGITLADYLKTVFDKDAMFSIEADGIFDNLSLFSCGKVQWNDITEVKIKKAMNTSILVIHVNNPDLLISKQSKWKRKVLRGFQKRYGTPVVVAQTRIKENVESVRDVIAERFQKR
jgi:hypothetical protein